MHINVEFLVVSYFVTLFVDWVFQWQWQALNKSKWERGSNYFKSAIAVVSHSFIYTLLSSGIIALVTSPTWATIHLIFWVLFLSHVIIDTRIPVRWIMKFKGLTDEQIMDYANYGFMHIGIDHRLHEAVLFVLALFVK